MIFTIGYDDPILKPANLVTLLDQLNVDWLIDVRSKPFSRIPGFHGKSLEALLGKGRYHWRGPVLGGLPPGVNVGALEQLAKESRAGHRMMLICKEHAPADCHRFTRIAVPLAQAGIPVLNLTHSEGEWWVVPTGALAVITSPRATTEAEDSAYDEIQSLTDWLQARSRGGVKRAATSTAKSARRC